MTMDKCSRYEILCHDFDDEGRQCQILSIG